MAPVSRALAEFAKQLPRAQRVPAACATLRGAAPSVRRAPRVRLALASVRPAPSTVRRAQWYARLATRVRVLLAAMGRVALQQHSIRTRFAMATAGATRRTEHRVPLVRATDQPVKIARPRRPHPRYKSSDRRRSVRRLQTTQARSLLRSLVAHSGWAPAGRGTRGRCPRLLAALGPQGPSFPTYSWLPQPRTTFALKEPAT